VSALHGRFTALSNREAAAVEHCLLSAGTILCSTQRLLWGSPFSFPKYADVRMFMAQVQEVVEIQAESDKVGESEFAKMEAQLSA